MNAFGASLKAKYAEHATNRAIIEIVKHRRGLAADEPMNNANANADIVNNTNSSAPNSSVNSSAGSWYEVGDVLFHKERCFRAVVIGWSVPSAGLTDGMAIII
jgi:hypothetical protein